MRICSYNLFCITNTPEPIPHFTERLSLLRHKISQMAISTDIFFFQEVTENNIGILKEILSNRYNFFGEEYPMLSAYSGRQYNIIAIRKQYADCVVRVDCVPHGTDDTYLKIENQIRDYGMTDYRASLIVILEINNKRYVLGNTQADHISIEGKVKGISKTLQYIRAQRHDYAMLLGDMNMVSHMSECKEVLFGNPYFTAVSKNRHAIYPTNSYHGYAVNESVNVDFAFVPKSDADKYEWCCYSEGDRRNEGSDHKPVVITISDLSDNSL